ncbi:alpha/beta hydrolase family protein [Aquimarina macrocephali]|uniref:alpha/beta hydrolase family protein n=1 Tax=Aquimarina macrocephali TaxID=666563 RepID=UPI000464B5E1|nr:prolyl oligopeptidase family serine peptidase [Aquimarina macrocephali]
MNNLVFKKTISSNLIILAIIILAYNNLVYGQKSTIEVGYPVEEYLSQINISNISISPNGKYIAIVTNENDFKENKIQKRLWQYEIDEKDNVIAKIEVPIFKNTISQLKWTSNSDFLLFKSKDNIGYNLFKISPKNPLIITPVINSKERLKKLYSYSVLDNNQIVFCEKISVIKPKTNSSFIKLPKENLIRHTVFKTFKLGSKIIDSLFTIKANVSYFEISPNKENIVYSNYKTKSYFSNDVYSESHTYIINSKNGSLIKQLTKDMVWDRSRWFTNDKVISMFTGDPQKNKNNRSFDQLYFIGLDNNTKKLIKNFKGKIQGFVTLKDKTVLINAEESTSSNLFIYKEDSFKKISDFKGTINNFTTNNNEKKLFAFSMVKNDSFEEVYIARSTEGLKTPIKITNFNEKLNSYPKPEIEKIIWKNSTGETIEGVLMWPPGKKGSKNLPFVVDIHGGPMSSRSEAITVNKLQYYYFASLLASKGFLVLQPNYRGSTGRGQEFVDAIIGNPKTKPTDDVLKGVEYVINEKWVDRNRMVVKGASYGGNLTNMIIGETTLFKVALTSCGIWNEIANFGTNDGDVNKNILFNNIKVWENPTLYRKESAIYNATKIKTPTLITHGEKDSRVPTSNAYAMYYTLRDLGVKTELLIFKGEGHVYRKPSNKLAKVKAELDFINKYINL